MTTYTLKGIKVATYLSTDSDAFVANLYADKKLITMVENDGRGGCHMYRTKPECREDVKAFMAWCETLPPDKFESNGKEYEIAMCDDLWVSQQVAQHLEDKDFKAKCKKSTLIRLTTDNEGEYQIYKNVAYTPAIADQLRKKHGDTLTEIINERYI